VKKSILVRTGYGAEVEKKLPAQSKPAMVVNDLNAAAEWIIRDEKP
jgi:hypothetical protein